jgi:hypothetical protein
MRRKKGANDTNLDRPTAFGKLSAIAALRGVSRRSVSRREAPCAATM